jgi:triosephosphate isomerase
MKYLMANWKANLDLSLFLELLKNTPEGANFVTVFVPFPVIWPVSKNLPFSVNLGAQDVSVHESGAHTGEVTAGMLSKLDVGQVLLGHSERRSDQDSMERVNKKLIQTKKEGLEPVICIGASQKEVDDSLIDGLISQLPEGIDGLKSLKIAYEPIFAIGTGQVADKDHIENVLKKLDLALSNRYPECKISLLYGGSVKPSNLKSILAIRHCSGVLVGNASLDLESWKELIDICKTFS